MNKQAVLFSLLAATFGTQAAPYTPASGNIVLERLPAKNDPAQRTLAAARARLAADPRNPALAAAVARHYITLGREDADPRYLGYAQAALAPWWSAPTPPAPVQLLRATILQSTHQFPAALRDLDQLVQADPADAQAWLTRATVQQVTGDFAGARQSCTRLFGIAPDLVLRTCLAGVGSLTGTARASYQALRQAYASHRSTDSGIADWVSTLLGEMAARLGDAPAAEQHFRQALALAPADAYLLGAYADFLLDQGRAAEAVPLLRGHEKADALLLRLGLALAATRAQDQTTITAMLAKQNWAVQKEPADLRILLDSAAAAQDKAAIDTVRAWIRQTGIEDDAVRRRLAAVAP
jgi:tetratricopeptide (TPR) repeat protein